MKYSLVRKPGAGKPPARFDERGVETEHGGASEAPANKRAGNRYAEPKPLRHTSTLLSRQDAPSAEKRFAWPFNLPRELRMSPLPSRSGGKDSASEAWPSEVRSFLGPNTRVPYSHHSLLTP